MFTDTLARLKATVQRHQTFLLTVNVNEYFSEMHSIVVGSTYCRMHTTWWHHTTELVW
jgi:hypothetical protein